MALNFLNESIKDLSSLPFWQIAALSKEVEGVECVHLFGKNDNLSQGTPETIWQKSTLYEFPGDGGCELEIFSSNALDAGIIFQVELLDKEFNSIIVDVSLDPDNGENGVLIDAPHEFCRVNRVINNDSRENIGDVQICDKETACVFGFAGAVEKESCQLVYTIPKGKTGFLLQYELGMSKTGGATDAGEFGVFKREFGKVFREVEHRKLISGGNSSVIVPFKTGIVFPEKSDIMIQASVTGNDISVSGAFDMILIDNNI